MTPSNPHSPRPAPHRGLLIAIAGPDGTGKTTLAQALLRELVPDPFPAGHYHKKVLRVLPRYRDLRRTAYRLARREYTPDAEEIAEAKAHADPAAGAAGRHTALTDRRTSLKSVLYPAWHALDMFAGRPRLGAMLRRGELVVFDRSFYDVYLQRSSRGTPWWFLDVVSLLVPRPDILFYIDRDAEEIYATKPELTLDELRRQQAAMTRLVRNRRWAVTLDGRGGPDATVAAALAEVRKVLRAR